MIIKPISLNIDHEQKTKERQVSRKIDAAVIQSGEKSLEEMNKENAFFNGKNMRIDFDGAKSLV